MNDELKKMREDYLALERKAWAEYEVEMKPYANLKHHDPVYVDAHNKIRSKYNATIIEPHRAFLKRAREIG